MNVIINNNVMKGELSKFLISEVCTKLVIFRSNRYSRSNCRFQNDW